MTCLRSRAGAGSKRGHRRYAHQAAGRTADLQEHIPLVIMQGDKPELIYSLLEGEPVGTRIDADAERAD